MTEWVSHTDPQNTEMQDWTELSPGTVRREARWRQVSRYPISAQTQTCATLGLAAAARWWGWYRSWPPHNTRQQLHCRGGHRVQHHDIVPQLSGPVCLLWRECVCGAHRFLLVFVRHNFCNSSIPLVSAVPSVPTLRQSSQHQDSETAWVRVWI